MVQRTMSINERNINNRFYLTLCLSKCIMYIKEGNNALPIKEL
jgi:hypothetical protein